MKLVLPTVFRNRLWRDMTSELLEITCKQGKRFAHHVSAIERPALDNKRGGDTLQSETRSLTLLFHLRTMPPKQAPTPSKAVKAEATQGGVFQAPVKVFNTAAVVDDETNTSGMSNVMKYALLALISVLSFAIRLFAVARWESVIHEFVRTAVT
jgi:hypothetical protein